jgi:hypothetical protein
MKVNWLAILVALVAQRAFGFFWYSRPLFADAWATAACGPARSSARSYSAGRVAHL